MVEKPCTNLISVNKDVQPGESVMWTTDWINASKIPDGNYTFTVQVCASNPKYDLVCKELPVDLSKQGQFIDFEIAVDLS